MAGLLASMSTMAMVYPVHARDVAASGDSFEDIAVADDGLVDEPNIAKKDADRGVDDDGRTITVIATRNADYVIDYPGSVTVIDSDVLRDIAPANLNDIFDQIPGTNIDGGPVVQAMCPQYVANRVRVCSSILMARGKAINLAMMAVSSLIQRYCKRWKWCAGRHLRFMVRVHWAARSVFAHKPRIAI